ncbi:hypothetical protein MRX96_002852 [Rhipicephalus microplus]
MEVGPSLVQLSVWQILSFFSATIRCSYTASNCPDWPGQRQTTFFRSSPPEAGVSTSSGQVDETGRAGSRTFRRTGERKRQ